ncbi:MAG: tyrosine-protein phosphatase [Ilumatobacteraceae bacterium]
MTPALTEHPTDTPLIDLLDVEGCFNVRDAGGRSTSDGRHMRQGLLYRADEPVRMTAAGRAVVDALDLRAVVDLRSEHHFERGPGFADPSRTYNVPVVDRVLATDEPPRIDSPADMARLYDGMVEFRRANIVRAVEIVAANVGEGPVLVHCMAGKDRTGIVVALIQAAIGVPLDSIVDDYARSDAATQRRRAEMVAHPLAGDPDLAAASHVIWTAPAETMELFATRAVERFGSLEDWATGLGVSAGAVADLRRDVLTD